MQTMHRAYDIYYMRQKIQPNVAFAVFLFFFNVVLGFHLTLQGIRQVNEAIFV
jgi:hypothetical protein